MDIDKDFKPLLDRALLEDRGTVGDLTSLALVPESAQGVAAIVSRSNGILAGVPLILPILEAVDHRLVWEQYLEDSAEIVRGSLVGILRGPACQLLTAERTVLNFLGRLSGIASLSRQYVDAIQGTKSQIYDTRKTTPGWRNLEKYAVRCGSGKNHRVGLYDAILIKDNHLAFSRQEKESFSPSDAVRQAKEFLRQRFLNQDFLPNTHKTFIEVEVDTLEQLKEVLPAEPDMILLDNMTPAQVAEAVRIRDSVNAAIPLEASGGITLSTIRFFAETGIERISVGALTHSAVSLDFGLDWIERVGIVS